MKKILIIEDHADIRKLLRMTLELENCEILETADGESGLLIALLETPDVVLLDMMMPGAMNGLDVCRAIKREHLLQHTRVVMLSARGQSSDREAGMAAGADDYMVKPFSPIQILETLQLLETAS